MAGKSIQEALPEGLKAELMPKHVAVILDGNRRWARDGGMEVAFGHREGYRVLLELVLLSMKWGIKVLSVFAFSTENWKRPNEEVDHLMRLFEEGAVTFYQDYCSRFNIRLSFMGDKSKLPEPLVELMNEAEEGTKSNEALHVMIGLNYSGRYDILQATRSIAAKVKDGVIHVEDINESLFGQELQTSSAEYPIPDLLIRTSGEQRISNFMLWQLAYTELFFCNKMLPDFVEQDYIDALVSYQKRDRRFGGVKY